MKCINFNFCYQFKFLEPSGDVNTQAVKLLSTSPAIMAVPASGALQYFLAMEKQVALEVDQAANLRSPYWSIFVFNNSYSEKLKPFYLLESILVGRSSQQMHAFVLKVILDNLRDV